MTKFGAILIEFEDTVNNLAKALIQEKTEFIRDSAIKRFELAFDMAWKVIKAFLEESIVKPHSALLITHLPAAGKDCKK